MKRNLPRALFGRRHPARRRGLSLPEMLTVISVIGILAGISIESYQGVQLSARENVARDRLALINRAVVHFGQANWELVLTPREHLTSDELAILRTLQWRNAEVPGSPYLPINFGDTMSSETDDFRLQWNGRMFELLEPGTQGAGLQADGTQSIVAGADPFPEDFEPVGPGGDGEG